MLNRIFKRENNDADFGDEQKNAIYLKIQKFLAYPPVIIWGSGATVAYGMPTMSDLNKSLKEKFDFFDKDNQNLEEELSKEKYKEHLFEIRNHIWQEINKKDESVQWGVVSDFQKFIGIQQLIEKFLEADPKLLNIITTNYDRVLENVLSKLHIPFTDGFTGRNLSSFDGDLISFSKRSLGWINLIKVHGSLDWFDVDGETVFLTKQMSYSPKIIPPGKGKYQDAFSEPYRTLIQKSDMAITGAKAFLVIGFGFNDEHITPKIVDKTKKGVPIVVVTKEITETTRRQLVKAENYIFISQRGDVSCVECKKGNDIITTDWEADFWRLEKFMEVF